MASEMPSRTARFFSVDPWMAFHFRQPQASQVNSAGLPDMSPIGPRIHLPVLRDEIHAEICRNNGRSQKRGTDNRAKLTDVSADRSQRPLCFAKILCARK